MGLLMDTESVKSQISEMNRNLEQMISNAQQMENKVEAFVETSELAADSYGNLKQYYSSVHLPVIRGFICYGEALCSANENYAAQIDSYLAGVGYVDEEGLGNDLTQIQNVLNIIDDMSKMTPAMFQIRQDMENKKWDIEEKLECIGLFLSATAGIYTGVNDIKVRLDQGISCMQGVQYNVAFRNFQLKGIDLNWSQSLNERWREREKNIKLNDEQILNSIENNLPELSNEDIKHIIEIILRNPFIQMKQSLLKYIWDNRKEIYDNYEEEVRSSTLETVLTAVGMAITTGSKSLGEYMIMQGGIAGPAAENSFVILESSMALTGSNIIGQGYKYGNLFSKAGKVMGPALSIAAIGVGTYEDVKEGKTIGEGIAHNTLIVGTGFVAGAILTSNPIGWGVLAAAGGTVLVSTMASWAYDNNIFGTKDVTDWVGHKIDEGLDWIGQSLSDIGEAIVSFA